MASSVSKESLEVSLEPAPLADEREWHGVKSVFVH